jgi:hypothetical protein
MAADLPAKLNLALKACSISRGRLAAEMGVDKSVVSRWLSGANAPSDHNLASLTTLVAQRHAGFSMLDWESDLDRLAVRLGVATNRPAASGAAASPAFAAPPGLDGWFPEPVMTEALATTALRGAAYEGFWRSTRLANDAPGRFVHDSVLIRRASNGLLSFRLGVVDMRFEGWTLPIQTQLFSFAADGATGVMLFSIFNAVLRNRAEVMDGLTLTLTRNAGGTPVVAAALLERVGELSGDPEADDARYEAAITDNPLAPEGSIPRNIRDHLFRDAGPTAFATGGAALLTMAFTQSMSRGPLTDRDLAAQAPRPAAKPAPVKLAIVPANAPDEAAGPERA